MENKEPIDDLSAKEEIVAENTETQTEENTQTEADETSVLNYKIAELNDKYIRLYSEFENFRRRTAKEKLELINNASENVLKELLPILDDFERGIKANENSKDAKNNAEGLKLIHSKLENTLKNKGLRKMKSLHEAFDADLHEAITKTPTKDKKLKGKIVDVLEDGYYLNDKVIRFAKVVLGE
jgi:molecular chaperone GrpE